jgi:hypothetical protein
MAQPYFTLASWHVAEGKDEEFIRVWQDELAPAFRRVSPGATGTLIQSMKWHSVSWGWSVSWGDGLWFREVVQPHLARPGRQHADSVRTDWLAVREEHRQRDVRILGRSHSGWTQPRGSPSAARVHGSRQEYSRRR